MTGLLLFGAEGRMGREVAALAAQYGFTLGEKAEAAIDFSHPDALDAVLDAVLARGIPLVSGTTGWTDRLAELQELCRERGGALFYASNYCLGVNLMFRLNRQLAAMIGRVGGYGVRIEEVHHTQKLDAPSGTAITLAEGILDNLADKQGWVNYAPGIAHATNRVERSEDTPADRIEIRSVREGAVPGIHTVTYESEDDVLEIRHTIKNRRTLALGAVVAAEFLCGKQGVFGMDDLLRN